MSPAINTITPLVSGHIDLGRTSNGSFGHENRTSLSCRTCTFVMIVAKVGSMGRRHKAQHNAACRFADNCGLEDASACASRVAARKEGASNTLSAGVSAPRGSFDDLRQG